mmetsp:Transcript_16229/g.31754  ORF Transcript_16229/g.31754 Transcript_16229/m.31754 type:complete len:270 (-) Transcript_16229:1767-2576(-)
MRRNGVHCHNGGALRPSRGCLQICCEACATGGTGFISGGVAFASGLWPQPTPPASSEGRSACWVAAMGVGDGVAATPAAHCCGSLGTIIGSVLTPVATHLPLLPPAEDGQQSPLAEAAASIPRTPALSFACPEFSPFSLQGRCARRRLLVSLISASSLPMVLIPFGISSLLLRHASFPSIEASEAGIWGPQVGTLLPMRATIAGAGTNAARGASCTAVSWVDNSWRRDSFGKDPGPATASSGATQSTVLSTAVPHSACAAVVQDDACIV